jgi:hypothetical protein
MSTPPVLVEVVSVGIVGPPGPPGPAVGPYLDLVEGVPVDPPVNTARLYALDVNGFTLLEMRDGAAKVLRLASDNVVIGKVTEPAGIARGQVVYIAGASGANVQLRLARADVLATMPGIGLALDAGAVNAAIRVLVAGTMQLLNTSGFVEGASVFVSPTTAGTLTATLPVAPAYAQRIGFVTRAHATQGEMLVLTTAVTTNAGALAALEVAIAAVEARLTKLEDAIGAVGKLEAALAALFAKG